MQRQGTYPPPPGATDIMGLEASGEIVEVGNEAKKQWNKGDKVWVNILCPAIEYVVYQVMVSVTGGSYAEYVAVYMGCAMKIPEGISMIEAAG